MIASRLLFSCCSGNWIVRNPWNTLSQNHDPQTVALALSMLARIHLFHERKASAHCRSPEAPRRARTQELTKMTDRLAPLTECQSHVGGTLLDDEYT